MDAFTDAEAGYMRRAIELAERGQGRTAPNPPVGCVLVKDGAIIAEGWHDRYGGLHAEAMALAALPPGEARGATAYVTLSPCATHGKQPPCADALAQAGVREVVAATVDPNPKNASGLDKLKTLGVPSRHGLLREEAEYAARGFFQRFRNGRPYVQLKYAMTLDGKIAASGGDSRWVTSPASREIVHDQRSRADAIMVGIGTALADDPLLTVRDPAWSRRGGVDCHRQPRRVVVDSGLRLPPSAAMLRDRDAPLPGGRVFVACLESADPDSGDQLEAAGAEVLRLPPAQNGGVSLAALLGELGKRGVDVVYCEGGSGLAAGLVAEELVDELIVFIAPKIVGGADAPGPVGDLGIAKMADARHLAVRETRRIGDDLMIRAVFA